SCSSAESWRSLQFGAALLQHFVPVQWLRGWWVVRDGWFLRSCPLALCRRNEANSTHAGFLLMVLVTGSAVLIAVGVGLAAFLTLPKHLRGYRIAEWWVRRLANLRVASVDEFFRGHNQLSQRHLWPGTLAG